MSRKDRRTQPERFILKRNFFIAVFIKVISVNLNVLFTFFILQQQDGKQNKIKLLFESLPSNSRIEDRIEVIKNYEKSGDGSFLFGFEESYGYLKGTYARDKDAVVTAMLICEMTAFYKARNMTLSDALAALFEKYGFCYEQNVEIYMEGLDGPARMAALMDGLRNNPPTEFGGVAVSLIGDYGKGTITEGNEVRPTGLPSSNVLYYRLVTGDVIVARPSGTEPKIKFYYMLTSNDKHEAEAKLSNYQKSLNALSENA